MSEDQTLNLVFAVGMLVLVVSVLFARRTSFRDVLRGFLGWVAIFAVFILGFSYQEELRAVWNRVAGQMAGGGQQVRGDTLEIAQSNDGHFWVTADVNGTPVRFLIDSGATTTAMNRGTADDAGLTVTDGGFPVILTTANGMVEAHRATIDSLVVGNIVANDFPVVVAEAFGDTNVLGMNFLSQMESWRVERNRMILVPPSR